MSEPTPDQISFDLTPQEFGRLGERLTELMIEAFEAERSEPVLRSVSGPELRALLDEPLPQVGTAPDDILTQWRDNVLPYCRRNGHPRFFGYVCTTADPLGVLADAMASALNQPVTAWRSAPAATEIERLVVRWLDNLVGFGGEGSGLLVSGGSSANFHAMACAVTRAEHRAGLPPGSRHRLSIYLSKEGHVSMRKGAQLLGVPPSQVRLLEIDALRRLRPDALRHALEEDRAAGLVPALIGLSAGTANTGAIDPLDEVADIAEEHDAWLHIDGSYGAPAVLTEEYAWMARSFERADSLSLDPHKWLFAPADVGCILIRNDEDARRAFTLYSEYTEITQTDPIERYALFDRGLEMSRRFRGLKVWTILKARGVEGLRGAISHDIALRRHLDQRIADHPRLESLGSELSISCFRYVPEGATDGRAVDAANRTIIETLVREGRCYMSPTTLEGKYSLRACIVSFRTQQSDVDFLVDEVLRVGALAAP
jgi:glutamate/tyrosine decarboxylase-like PLP-dependent enzyme